MMQYVAENPSNVDKFDQLEWSCVHTVAYAIHPQLLTNNVTQKQLNTLKQLFMQKYNDLMRFGSDGNLPIHLACQMNNSLILQIIIDVAKEKFSKEQFKQMLNETKKDEYWNYTPLMIAIKNNSVDCVKILCNYDYVVNGILEYKSRYPNYNALEFACYYNNVDTVKILSNLVIGSQQLNSKEYISHLMKIANYGLSKGYLDSKCIKFLNELSNNYDTLTDFKEENVDVKGTRTGLMIQNNQDDDQSDQLMCCNNHVLPSTTRVTPEKCDICQDTITGCRSCSKCAANGDCNLFPVIFCQTCVTATSLWSTIVHATVNQELEQTISDICSLIDPDMVNRVEFWILVVLWCEYECNLMVYVAYF